MLWAFPEDCHPLQSIPPLPNQAPVPSELFAVHVTGMIVNYSELFAVYFVVIIGNLQCILYYYYVVSQHGGVYTVLIHITKAGLAPSADQFRAYWPPLAHKFNYL